MEYKVIHDSTTAGIRTVKLNVQGFSVSILHAPKMEKSIHVTFEQPDPFGPKIDYVKGRFILTYGYVVVPENFRDDFRESYEETVRFCDTVKPELEAWIHKIKNGERL